MVNSLHGGYLSSAVFFIKIYRTIFKNKKKPSGTLSECKKIWIQIGADILSALIWFQTVSKSGLQIRVL